ncbi:hypothetical protein ACFLZI_00415 [Nitrospirota bacterium]
MDNLDELLFVLISPSVVFVICFFLFYKVTSSFIKEKKLRNILIMTMIFFGYMVWGTYLMWSCYKEVTEACIAGSWALLFTGLPSTLMLIGMGGASIPEMFIYALVGGCQWAALSLLFLWWIDRRKERRL